MLPTRPRKRKSRFGVTPLLLLTWWFTSVTGTLINKKVMKQFPFPIAFTSLHLVVGAFLDFLILYGQQKSRGHLLSATSNLRIHLSSCTLNGVMFSMAKYLTYLSYRQVPVSLTHTVKSMSPVFTVLSQLIIFKHCVPISELITLIPITLGVVLSTVHEIHFEMLGFIAAVSATVLGVAQNTTSKYVLTRKERISPMELHMFGSLLSLILLIPLSLKAEAASIMEIEVIPYNQMLMSCCWLYGQTMASLFLLKRVTTVTHNVANTCKRFWIILVSIIYFKQETTIWNLIGVILALSGFFLYQRVHRLNRKKGYQLLLQHRLNPKHTA